MILKLKKPFLNADDIPFRDGEGKELLMSKVLATELWKTGKENVLKLYDWGMDLWKKGEITVSRTDVDLLKGIIENNETWDIFSKGRFLDEFKSLK